MTVSALPRGAWALALALICPLATAMAGDDGPKPKPAYFDEMIEEAWKDAGITPSPIAKDDEFLRRIYLDLLGRTPSLAEAREFLGQKDSDKRLKLIEKLLAHPDFPRNFSIVWTNILIGRNNDTQNLNPNALRTWLRRQFADNRPWNEIARELIAAEGDTKSNGATNFVYAHLQDNAVNLTSNTTRVFLGQQIQCTQCHDHPSNDWKQADFWGINAFLRHTKGEQVRVADPVTGREVVDSVKIIDEMPDDLLVSYDRRNGLVEAVPPKYLDGRTVERSEGLKLRATLAQFVTEPENENFPKAFVNRMFAHFFGRGIVHPVDDFGDHNQPTLPDLLDQLAVDFQEGGYNVRDLIRWICASKAYNLTSQATSHNKEDDIYYSHMALKPMTPEQLYESLLTATGADKAGGAGDEKDNRRSNFARQFVSTFSNDEGGESVNFQGTIPQALLMMNGREIIDATSGKPGTFLGKLWDEAKLQRGDPKTFLVNHIYLAALSRLPSPKEMKAAQAFFAGDRYRPDTVAQDLFWALLNSNEFVLNH